MHWVKANTFLKSGLNLYICDIFSVILTMAESPESSSETVIECDTGNVYIRDKTDDYPLADSYAQDFGAAGNEAPIESAPWSSNDKKSPEFAINETISSDGDFQSTQMQLHDHLSYNVAGKTLNDGSQTVKDEKSVGPQHFGQSISSSKVRSSISGEKEIENTCSTGIENDTQARKFYALYQSFRDRDYVTLKKLVIEHKIDVNHTFTESFVEPQYRGWKMIHMVCQEGNIIGLEIIVALGGDTTVKTHDGESALLLSFKNGHYDCVRYLVKQGDSLQVDEEEIQNDKKGVEHQKSETKVAVSEILSETAAADIKENSVEANKQEYSYNDLFESLKDKDYKKLGNLVKENKVDINHIFTEAFIELPYRGWRLVHFVCKKGNIDGLEIITSLGADTSAKTRNGDTALHISCKHGNYDCVKFLLQVCNYLKDIKNSQGLSPLMKALFRCDTVFKEKAYRKTIQILIESGCDVNLCPDSNVSPLHVVAGKWNSSYILDMLIRAGANVNAVAANKSPLMTALCRQKVDTTAVKLLIDAGADVDFKNFTGKSLLHIAVSKSEDKCVEYLLNAGADPNIEDESGDSPLWIAVNENNIKIAPLLLRYGGNVNFRKSPYQMSLLCNAANRRYRKMVELLMDHGADVNAETALGASALHYAIDEGDIEIMKMLLRKNCYMDNYSLFKDLYNPHSAFQIALEEGDEQVIKLLCEVGCPMPEFCLKPDRLPRGIKDNEDLIDWLYEYHFNPPTLLNICRVKFRRMCGPQLQEVIEHLLSDSEIPHRLAECILMADLLDD